MVAYARHPEKLGLARERLTVIPRRACGRRRHRAHRDRLGRRHRLLGQGKPVKGTPVALGTRTILAAMSKAGVRRIIIVVATAIAPDPNDRPPLRSRFFIGIAKVFLRPAYDDVIATARAVRDSDRDWTIVRPPFLRDGPRTGRVKVGYLGDGVSGTYLSRGNAADFMLRQLESDQYVGQAPIVSDARRRQKERSGT